MSEPQRIPAEIWNIRKPALVIGVAGLIACALGMWLDPADTFVGYLIGVLWGFDVSLGALLFLMIHTLTGGNWGTAIRRILEAATMVLPLMILLFLPLLLGLDYLYPWSRPEEVLHSPAWQERQIFFTDNWFALRAGICMLIWLVLALLMRHWSLRMNRDNAAVIQKRMRGVSAAGLVLFVLTVTSTYVDWVMTREPEWHSTMIGFIAVGGQAVAGLSFAVLMLTRVHEAEPYRTVVQRRHLNDLGTLMITTVIFFSYVTFAQYLIMWAGNSQEENTWYYPRAFNGWKWVALALIVFHFFVPFLLLLFREFKRSPRMLGRIAGLLLAVHWVALIWMIVPSSPDPRVPGRLHWPDVVAPLGISGVWFAVFLWNWDRRALMPEVRHSASEEQDDVGLGTSETA